MPASSFSAAMSLSRICTTRPMSIINVLVCTASRERNDAPKRWFISDWLRMLGDRSISVFILVKFLVDPMPPVMASPNSSVYEAARYRSPWNDDRPEMPNFGPGRFRLQCLFNVIPTAGKHGCDLKEIKPPSGIRSLDGISAFTRAMSDTVNGNARRRRCNEICRRLSLTSLIQVNSGTNGSPGRSKGLP